MPITHAKVSVIPDGANPNQVQASTDWNADHVGAGGTLAELLTVTIDLSATEMATLSSVGAEAVAAQGAGTMIVPVAASVEIVPGTISFLTTAQLTLSAGLPASLQTGTGVAIDWADGGVAWFGMVQAGGAQGVIDNLPLMLSADADPIPKGAILTASVDNAGSGYAPGDTGQILNEGGVVATYAIDSVGGGGEVATFHITSGGTEYWPQAGFPTNTSGIGTGFTVSVDSITPLTDVALRLTVLFYVMELL